MRLPKCVLRIVNVFTIEAAGEGDCLFNLFVQGLNQLSINGGEFNVESLRQTFNLKEVISCVIKNLTYLL